MTSGADVWQDLPMTNHTTDTTDTAEATFAEVAMVPTAALPNRDARGRFQCQPLHIDFVRTRGTFWTDDRGDTHSRRHCGDASGRTRRTPTSGWLCSTCVEVDGDHGLADEDMKATKRGSAVCEGCDRMLGMSKFPTALISGVGQIRDFRVCRDCRKAGIHPVGEAGVDANDPDALAAAVASDWRPRRRFDRTVGRWVPILDATLPRTDSTDDDTIQPVLVGVA